MADTKTLDQRIRDRARTELRAKLKAAIGGIMPFVGWHEIGSCNLYMKCTNGDYKPASSQWIVEQLEEQLYREGAARAEDLAVADFIRRVDDLQTSVDELRDLSHEH